MSIMELGAIGELVGGVAVIASLLFVGIQIRRGNETDSLSASLGVQRSLNECVQFLTANPEAFHQGLGDFNELPVPARVDVAAKFNQLYSHCELVYQLKRRGLIRDDEANRHFLWLFWIHRWPGPQEWWNVGPALQGEQPDANRDLFSSDFAEFVDRGSLETTIKGT
ncbi:MAG: hypothetical protein GWO40_21170 [Gammaproteobacteria bacterium]|nr:hypothetical protein [Gammaproteobacteria bacterium]NIV53677.1 hypothetical protein [Gammaproteobacteria bacterium]NIW85204.1 hypothetical protein [Gammaproteobacteria bacterium]NIX88017.1 hypothetical protein [Gammaproteobacteria bacterium]